PCRSSGSASNGSRACPTSRLPSRRGHSGGKRRRAPARSRSEAVRRKVVLYNPRCTFYTMPLALIALASRLDAAEYDVRILDRRLEPDPAAAVLEHADEAICLGITVLTGAPILDALEITRAARERRPDLPVIWG